MKYFSHADLNPRYNIHKLKEDGADHYRVGESTTTTLGELLSVHYRHPFVVSGLGEFESVRNLAAFLYDENNNDSKRFGRPASKSSYGQWSPTPNHDMIMAIGMYERIGQIPDLKDLLVTSGETPLVLYRLRRHDAIRTRPFHGLFVEEVYHDARLALMSSTPFNAEKYRTHSSADDVFVGVGV
jgi:hypothetical protein